MNPSIINYYEERYDRFWSRMSWLGCILMPVGMILGIVAFLFASEPPRFARTASGGFYFIPVALFGMSGFGMALFLISRYKCDRFQESLFMRSIAMQADWLKISTEQACREIDRDIGSCGKRFGKLYIGKEWILSDVAMPTSRILEVSESRSSGASHLIITTVDGKSQFHRVSSDDVQEVLQYIQENILNLQEEKELDVASDNKIL